MLTIGIVLGRQFKSAISIYFITIAVLLLLPIRQSFKRDDVVQRVKLKVVNSGDIYKPSIMPTILLYTMATLTLAVW